MVWRCNLIDLITETITKKIIELADLCEFSKDIEFVDKNLYCAEVLKELQEEINFKFDS